jgi:hypothetical protein
MAEKPYQNREVDKMFLAVHDRFDSQDKSLNRIESQVEYTNGKIKKIIVALVLTIGFVLGIMGKEIIPLVIKLI